MNQLTDTLNRVTIDLRNKYESLADKVHDMTTAGWNTEVRAAYRDCTSYILTTPSKCIHTLARILDDKIIDEIPLNLHLLILHDDAAGLDPSAFGFTPANITPSDKTCPFSVALASRPHTEVFSAVSLRNRRVPIRAVMVDASAPGFDQAMTMLTLCTGTEDVKMLTYDFLTGYNRHDFSISAGTSSDGGVNMQTLVAISPMLAKVAEYFKINGVTPDIDMKLVYAIFACNEVVQALADIISSLDDKMQARLDAILLRDMKTLRYIDSHQQM